MKPYLFVVALVSVMTVVSCGNLYAQAKEPIDMVQLGSDLQTIVSQYKQLKVGDSRKQLLQHFSLSGGLSTYDEQTFVYNGCPYIKIDVKFKLRNSRAMDPNDVIISLSKLYLDFPVFD